MEQLNAVAFWNDSKVSKDIVVFDNKWSLNKFVKEYKAIFKSLENDTISYEDFVSITKNLFMSYNSKIIERFDGVWRIGPINNVLYDYDKKYKYKVINFLDSGL